MQRRTRVALIAAAAMSAVAAPSAASADGPVPRGPVGGCGQGFEVVTQEEAAAISPGAGAAALEVDVNDDGSVCIKFLDRRPVGGGTMVDNVAVGRA